MFVYRTVHSSVRMACMLNSCQALHLQLHEIKTEEGKYAVDFYFCYYFLLTPVLSCRGMKKLCCAIQEGTKTKLEWILLLLLHTKSSAIAEGPRDASCQLKSCQLPRNSAETTCMTSPEQIEVMKLKCYSKAMYNKHVHSTMTRSSRFHCPVGVINKPTTVELWISPVYRRLAVAKFSKSTM